MSQGDLSVVNPTDHLNLTEPVAAEPANAEPTGAEPVNVEPAKAEPVNVEPAKAEPVKAEPVNVELAKAEPVKTEVAGVEPVKALQLPPKSQVVQSNQSAQTLNKSTNNLGRPLKAVPLGVTVAQVNKLINSITELIGDRKPTPAMVIRIVAQCLQCAKSLKLSPSLEKKLIIYTIENYISQVGGLTQDEVDLLMVAVDTTVDEAVDTLNQLKKDNKCCVIV